MKRVSSLLFPIMFLCLLLGCVQSTPVSFTLEDLPAFSDQPYVVLGDNQPEFSQEELTTASFESYSPLDLLGRCGPAWASVGIDLMPTEERGAIGQVKPSGWQTVKYDFVDGILYNRCHLLAISSRVKCQPGNLITAPRYLNVDGMLPLKLVRTM